MLSLDHFIATPLSASPALLFAAIKPSRRDNIFSWLSFTSGAHHGQPEWALSHHAVFIRPVAIGDLLLGAQDAFNCVAIVRAFTDWSDADPHLLFGIHVPEMERFEDTAPFFTRRGQDRRARLLEDEGLLPRQWFEDAFGCGFGPRTNESHERLASYLGKRLFPWREKLRRPHALMRSPPGEGSKLRHLLKIEGPALETQAPHEKLPAIYK